MKIPVLLQKKPVLLDERKSAPSDTLEKMIQEYEQSLLDENQQSNSERKKSDNSQ